MHYFPLWWGPIGNRKGLLVMNHEYTDASQIYSAAQGATITPDEAGAEKVAKALAAHGVTVVEVQQQRNGTWTHVVGSKLQPSHHRHHADGVLSGPVGQTIRCCSRRSHPARSAP